MRRVVTGHTADGTAVVVSDEGLAPTGDDFHEFVRGALAPWALGPGDVVVQNGTRHRWHNRGDTIARMLSVTVGAHNRLEGGRPV